MSFCLQSEMCADIASCCFGRNGLPNLKLKNKLTVKLRKIEKKGLSNLTKE